MWRGRKLVDRCMLTGRSVQILIISAVDISSCHLLLVQSSVLGGHDFQYRLYRRVATFFITQEVVEKSFPNSKCYVRTADLGTDTWRVQSRVNLNFEQRGSQQTVLPVSFVTVQACSPFNFFFSRLFGSLSRSIRLPRSHPPSFIITITGITVGYLIVICSFEVCCCRSTFQWCAHLAPI